MLKMACKNDISVDVINNIPIREDGWSKIYQTSKYKVLKNGTYYVHHDWDKNQKVREKVEVTCPCYDYEGCDLKLTLKTFTYKILPKKRGGVLRPTSMWYGRPFRWARRNWISFKIKNKSKGKRYYPDFW